MCKKITGCLSSLSLTLLMMLDLLLLLSLVFVRRHSGNKVLAVLHLCLKQRHTKYEVVVVCIRVVIMTFKIR